MACEKTARSTNQVFSLGGSLEVSRDHGFFGTTTEETFDIKDGNSTEQSQKSYRHRAKLQVDSKLLISGDRKNFSKFIKSYNASARQSISSNEGSAVSPKNTQN